MVYYPRTTHKSGHIDYLNREIIINSAISKRMYILMFMIDGYNDSPPHFKYSEKRGGRGYVAINRPGGFGYDAVVKRMIRNGEIRITRTNSVPSSFGSFHNRTSAVVTDKGREIYKKWKDKNGKRFGIE